MPEDGLLASVSNLPSCSVVQMLEYDERCAYVRETSTCSRMGNFGNYIEILYCQLKPHNDTEQILCSFLLMTICILIYIVLGCTVENIFCPALKVVSKMLGLNEHLAGVTLLAFGNGSPDLIGTFSNLDGAGPMFPDLFGAGVYVVLLVAGLIFVFYPFEIQWHNVLRDACFLSFGIIYVDYCCVSDGVVTRTESVLIMSVYILYLMVIFIELFLLKQTVKLLQSKLKDRKYATAANLAKLQQLRAEAGIEIIDRTSRLSIDVNRTRTMSFDAILNKPNKDLMKQFFESLNPIQKEEWLESGVVGKLYIAITVPVLFVLQVFIPVVDYEKERHGWSKLLNSIQIPWVPMILIYTLCIPLYCYTLLITVPITIYMLYTTRTDIPPNYHHITALYGVISSVLIIYYSASESVEILRVIGIVTNRSNSFLGCTLQAWGNSIGDLVSTIALARHGYPKMGYAACFGGPFFNSISSFGGVFIYETFRSETPIFVPQGSLGENCVVFQFIATMSVLIWATLTNFSARRSIGIFNFILYAIFLVFVFLGELEIIETFAPENEEEIIDE
ncbi:PREDICTED: sodium/potassium/calcium exchanger 6, mitochondrial isoform X2 [Bactrocera latifrons]|uniref:sodium/potassium/calcium exchanger 6, mitochondrial isoform X2 n=1 Tax=Bactrocera latifrons TaxID=174628 RepID=UPI0008DCE1B4|nr:PREDICTED: sodium/potassium/calcium exchanger 6, mitochondrial isoform X2 [Bactrocera latifrons]